MYVPVFTGMYVPVFTGMYVPVCWLENIDIHQT